MAEYKLVCADCGHATPENLYYINCPSCTDGFLEVSLAEVPEQPVDERFASIFKFHPVMPYDPIVDDISSFENIPDTPVVRADRLSDRLGVELLFKDEIGHPTGTWKDREGFVSIHRLLKTGVNDLFVFSSGNTGTSLARSASIVKGPKLHLVVPEASRERVATYRQYFPEDFVVVHFFDGSNDECIGHAKSLAASQGVLAEGGFRNYARREGLKLLGLELALSWGEPYDWYVQPVAGGIGVYSLEKAYRDIGRLDDCPKILGVQAAVCAPMVNAWRDGSPRLEQKHIPQTVVPSDFVRVLRTRDPSDSYPILKSVMDRCGGRFEDANDEQIYEGLRLLYLDDYYRDVYAKTGRVVGLEPATALAGIVKGVRDGYIRKGERVVLNVSGAAKDGDIKPNWLSDLITIKEPHPEAV